MTWLLEALGEDRLALAREEAARRRLRGALRLTDEPQVGDAELQRILDTLEVGMLDAILSEDRDALRTTSGYAFEIARVLPPPEGRLELGEWLLRLGCMALLGDRGPDVRRMLLGGGWPECPVEEDEQWGTRVWGTTLDLWLRLFRKHGWDDLDAVQQRIAALREDQRRYERGFLAGLDEEGPAWQLVALYHLSRAAEVLGLYLGQGEVEARHDVREQLQAQFDRALAACERGGLIGLETTTRFVAATAEALVANSLWTVTRAVNSRVSRFVRWLTGRECPRPIFEVLPPQRRALREKGLLGSIRRSVVVSLPTSGGKTMIAQFRMLQALNQFDAEGGWVAYVAPTRALVNQVAVRLRRDFQQIGIGVERVSPALEVDGLEAAMLVDPGKETRFRVLVSTPEKLDLLLRGGWEAKIERPLTLVVVDEAHGLQDEHRGIKLELLLATVNRECRSAQFLLLTPFVPNSGALAEWLDPSSNQDVSLGVEWTPNDRAVVIVEPERREGGATGAFSLRLHTMYTTHPTLAVPETLDLEEGKPLGLSWSKVRAGPGALAAATADVFGRRGPVIVLAGQPRHCWGLAQRFVVPRYRRDDVADDVKAVQDFVASELGEGFPLVEMLGHGVAVHHAGLSDEVRAVVEWLVERDHLNVLVATTTVAQGVNFPVSGVVLAAHQYPYGVDMPAEDFWNIAGRAGRVDQGDLGLVALVAPTVEKRAVLERFVRRQVGELNSTLVAMVEKAMTTDVLPPLESLSVRPAWSAFLQYLVHSYRMVGDHDRFADDIEHVLRGTLGFRELRRSHRGWADQLVARVRSYAERLRGVSGLKLVDSTGFSWESVGHTLARLRQQGIDRTAWEPGLLEAPRPHLATMMGLLLHVPEIRESLEDVFGKYRTDGDRLARIVCDWVAGKSLRELADKHFRPAAASDADDATLMTDCCRSLYGKLTQTASWGLSALMAMSLGDDFESLDAAEQRRLRNLPGRVYYGVPSDEALALRLAGVPRLAALRLAASWDVAADEPPARLRDRLREAGETPWRTALGKSGAAYHRVWTILEGDAS